MKKYRFTFHECEHWDDASNCEADVIKSGGRIVGNTTLDEDEESCTVTREADDPAEFERRFKLTESYQLTQ